MKTAEIITLNNTLRDTREDTLPIEISGNLASSVHIELSLEYYLQAVKLFKSSDFTGAVALLKRALFQNPALFEAHYLLGTIYSDIHADLNSFAAAAEHLLEAVNLKQDSASAHYMLAKALINQGFQDVALFHLRNALEIEPTAIYILCTLRETLSSTGAAEESEQLLNSYAEIGKNDPLWHFTMAMQNQTAHPQKALEHYREALVINPNYHEAGLNYAVLLLSLGMFKDGWLAYEHRIPWLGLNSELNLFQRWSGEPLSERAILLATEQGFGDTIQFIRYARLLKDQGATVYVLCTNNLPLRSILQNSAGVDGVIAANEPVPHIDYYIQLMSIPLFLNTELENIPDTDRYIVPDKYLVNIWQERLQPYSGMKIGIVWAGGRALKSNRNRSMSFKEFSYLLRPEPRLESQSKAFTFFTLQVGADAATPEDLAEHGDNLVDLTSQIHDFSDTAAFIENLDLVISVDTAVAHLAGALGKLVWTLLYYPAEWRWMRERSDTPWYKSMRLFRQNSSAEWGSVLENVKQELERFKTKKYSNLR